MRLAITGGTGIIGKKVLELLPKKHEALVLGRSSLNNFYQANNTKCSYVQTDYKIDSLNNILNKVDAVVHLAAQRLQKSAPDSSFSNTLLDYNIFKACEMSGISNIVFMSTCGVYGSNPNTPRVENSELKPENPYALGKVLSEQSASYFNKGRLSIKCLRLAQVLSPNVRDEYMLGTFIENALNDKPLELYATENQKREFIYINDVVNGIVAALNKPKIQGIFNLGSGELISIPKLAKLIVEKSGTNSKVERHIAESDREEYSLMDSQLFYTTFNFEINWTIEEALSDIFNQLKS